MRPVFICDFGKFGNLVFSDGVGSQFRAYNEYLKEKYPNSKFELQVRPLSKKRTVLQNSKYWALVTILGRSYGYSKDDMHEMIMEACDFGEYLDHPFKRGQKKFVRQSSTKLTTRDFALMINFILDEIEEFNEGLEESEWIKVPESMNQKES